MSGAMEATQGFENLQIEERQNEATEQKQHKKWLVPAAVISGALFAAVCFGVGFAIAYFTAPGAGR